MPNNNTSDNKDKSIQYKGFEKFLNFGNLGTDGLHAGGLFNGKSANYVNNFTGAASMLAPMAGTVIGGGMTSGVGNVMNGLAPITQQFGPMGQLASAGLNVGAGIYNRLGGSSIDAAKVAAARENINALNNFNTNAGDYDTLASNIANQPGIASITKVGKDGVFANKASRMTNDLRNDQLLAIDHLNASILNNQNNIAENQLNNMESNYLSLGGFLGSHGGDFSNGLMQINAGGSHEDNPYEGVQQGVDPQGIPNLVEEGETIYDDYVYSKRINTPEDIKNKYKLGGKKQSISFADASKKLAKESEERPNDPISRRTLEATMNELKEAQEQVKQEQRDAELVNQLMQLSPEEQQMALAQMQQQEAMQDPQVQEQLAQEQMMQQQDPSLQGLMPQGYAFGGNLFDDGGEKERQLQALKDSMSAANEATFNEDSFDYAFPFMDRTFLESNLAYLKQNNPSSKRIKNLEEIRSYPTFKQLLSSKDLIKYRDQLATSGSLKTSTDSGVPLLPTWQRNVPLWVNAATLFQNIVDKPSNEIPRRVEDAARATTNYDRIKYTPTGNYLTYKPFDVMLGLNNLSANANASRKDLMNKSGLNNATARAGILASDNNLLNTTGNLLNTAFKYNADDRKNVLTFNNGIDMANAEGALKAASANQSARQAAMQHYLSGMTNAANMRSAIEANRNAGLNANLTNLVESMANVGSENLFYNMANTNEVLRYYSPDKSGASRYKKSKGGNITRKKGGKNA